jgi:hypothetical protein
MLSKATKALGFLRSLRLRTVVLCGTALSALLVLSFIPLRWEGKRAPAPIL